MCTNATGYEQNIRQPNVGEVGGKVDAGTAFNVGA